MSVMLGRWNRWYEGLTEEKPYGSTETYALGAKWLEDCDVIEDWGTGGGYFRKFVDPHVKVRGIDGSKTPFADVIADLTTYTSSVCGVFLRHVLEHNYDWRHILDNACRSAQSRLFIAIFTPLVFKTRQIDFNEELGVPDISFNLNELLSIIVEYGFVVQGQHLTTNTQYGEEVVLKGKRP